MLRYLLLLLSLIFTCIAYGQQNSRPTPEMAIKLNAIPVSFRYNNPGAFRIQLGFEKKIAEQKTLLFEAGYASSFGGTLFSRLEIRDLLANLSYRKYFDLKKVSRKYWAVHLTQDLYSHENSSWICLDDCLYRRVYRYHVQDWRSGLMAGVGIVIQFNPWLSLDFDASAGFYARRRILRGLSPELDTDRINFGFPENDTVILPHFLHRIRLSFDLY